MIVYVLLFTVTVGSSFEADSLDVYPTLEACAESAQLHQMRPRPGKVKVKFWCKRHYVSMVKPAPSGAPILGSSTSCELRWDRGLPYIYRDCDHPGMKVPAGTQIRERPVRP